MSAKRLLITAVVALSAAVAAPAVAQAGAGPGDDIADAVTPNTPGAILPLSTAADPHILGADYNTSNYTTESGEPLTCASSNTSYNRTAWAAFKAPQYGRVALTAAGYDSVITLVDATTNRIVDCTDRLFGNIELFPNDALPTVKKGHVYGVQVGATGSATGGPLTLDMELIPPQNTIGDAVLTWLSGSGGVKIKSLKINAPRGSVVTVGCLKKSCGKARSFAVRKPVFRQKIAGVDLRQRLGAGSPGAELSFAKTTAHAAAKPNLNGKRIKNGDTLIVAVQREDEIGVIYFWTVKRNGAGSKNVGCIEPNSTKIKRVGSCTGR